MRKVYKPINDQAVASKDAAGAALASAKIAQQALIASARPWIDIKNIAIDDICVDSNGARVPVEIDITNIGHSPALRVEPWTASTISLQGAPEQRSLFEKPPFGTRDLQQPDTLFSDNLPHHRVISAYVPNSQLKWLQDKKNTTFAVRTDVCVDYGFGGADFYPHQTCYSLTLTQKPSGFLITTIPTPQTCATNVGYTYGGPGQSLAN